MGEGAVIWGRLTESFIVVVVGGVKTVEKWCVYYHCAENKRWIFQISP